MQRTVSAAVLGLVLASPAPRIWAASFAVDGVNTCTTINCAAKTIQGSYTSIGFGLSAGDTWVYQVLATAGECLRLEITQSSADTEMAVVSPDPAAGAAVNNIWADDDSGGGLRPLIKIDPVPRTGRYTVVVSRFSSASGNANFSLRYGRYDGGNPNCDPPSSPGGVGAGAVLDADGVHPKATSGE